MYPEYSYYVYRGIVRSVYDGDTIRADIDLGFNIWIKNEPLRLFGINAPEVRGDEREKGLITRDWLREQIPEGTEISISTRKDTKGKYGRYLATVFKGDFYDSVIPLNDQMVELGLAEVNFYK